MANSKSVTETNSLISRAIYKNGRVYINASSQTSQGNLGSYDIPYEYGMWWYPLSLYVDYSYYTNWNNMLVSFVPETPKELKDYFYNPEVKRTPFLKEFYDYTNNKIGKDDRMYIMNSGITLKLKAMGLATWDEYYNEDDVANNFKKLSNTMVSIEEDIFKREEKEGVLYNKKVKTLEYATEEELAMLMDVGMGYRMNRYMQKVVNAMNK